MLVAALALPASALAWGGSYPPGDRYASFVQIQVADSYTQDQVVPQDWATYLGTLIHGPEISKLTLNLVPQDSVQAVCGRQAPRLLRPASPGDLRLARGPAGRAAREGGGDPRVRPPHRQQQRRRAVGRTRLRHQTVVLLREHLREGRDRYGVARR